MECVTQEQLEARIADIEARIADARVAIINTGIPLAAIARDVVRLDIQHEGAKHILSMVREQTQ